MRELSSRSVVTYRRHRITLCAQDGGGWAALIRSPGRAGPRGGEVLRNSVPRGHAILLDEARQRIDRSLDGAAWQRAP
jgi:hypothetical protein